MKTEGCREWRELLGAHALGQLRDEERIGLEAHLEGCAECRAELAALTPVAAMLPHADPARFESAPQPPAELGRLGRVAAELRLQADEPVGHLGQQLSAQRQQLLGPQVVVVDRRNRRVVVGVQ